MTNRRRRTASKVTAYCGHCANLRHDNCYEGKHGCACADSGHGKSTPTDLAASMARYVNGGITWKDDTEAALAWLGANDKRGVRPKRARKAAPKQPARDRQPWPRSVRTAPEPLPSLFVYGTLRTGEGLARGYLPDSLFTRREAMIGGTLHWHFGGGYPVFDPDGDGVVLGEVVTARPDRLRDARRMMGRTLSMERGAGYSIEPTQVVTDDGKADTFVCAWRHEARGPVIEGGDWCQRGDFPAEYCYEQPADEQGTLL